MMHVDVCTATFGLVGVFILVLCDITQSYVIEVIQLEEITGLTCWTCPERSSNDACNDWAPDKFCSENRTVCQTFHRLNWRTQESLLVTKRCTFEHECNEAAVGCFETHHPDILECISCCTESYCNELIPFNHTSALALSSVTNTASISQSPWRPHWTLLIFLLILFLHQLCLR